MSVPAVRTRPSVFFADQLCTRVRQPTDTVRGTAGNCHCLTERAACFFGSILGSWIFLVGYWVLNQLLRHSHTHTLRNAVRLSGSCFRLSLALLSLELQ
jgi:hypothetical protein